MYNDFPTLSVVIPVYNEESTLEEILGEVSKSEIVTEIILIDDCSTDKTSEIVESYQKKNNNIILP